MVVVCPEDEDWIEVMVMDDGIARSLCRLRTRETMGEIWDVCTRRPDRKKGYGYMLIQGVLRVARDLGLLYVILVVKRDNTPARRLYEKCGFSVAIDERDCITMMRELVGGGDGV